jgi:7,8-dihydroneopterin aldolase/epimerase/oxygenase
VCDTDLGKRRSVSDTIEIIGLAFFGFHGALPEEKTLGQRFTLDLVAALDTTAVAQSDALKDTVCYDTMAQIALRCATQNRFRTLEALAHAVAETLLQECSRLQMVRVRVEKPSVPIQAVLRFVAVSVERYQLAP